MDAGPVASPSAHPAFKAARWIASALLRGYGRWLAVTPAASLKLAPECRRNGQPPPASLWPVSGIASAIALAEPETSLFKGLQRLFRAAGRRQLPATAIDLIRFCLFGSRIETFQDLAAPLGSVRRPLSGAKVAGLPRVSRSAGAASRAIAIRRRSSNRVF